MEPNWRQEDLELRHLFRRIRRNSLSVSFSVFLGMVAGFIYLVVAEPRYTAKAALILATDTGAFGNVETLLLDLDTHAKLMRSDTIVAKVVQRLDLENTAGFRPESGTLESLLNLSRERLAQPILGEVRHLDDYLEDVEQRKIQETELYRVLSSVPMVRKNVGVLRLGQTRLLELSFTSRDPQLSAKVANTFAKVYLEHLSNIGSDEEGAPLAEFNALAINYSAEGEPGATGLFDDLRVVSWATVPTTHSKPNIHVMLAAFAMMGFFVGVCLAVRKEWNFQA